jgi:hypothetical protein
LDAVLKLVSQDPKVINKAVLLVGMVLETKLRKRGMTQLVGFLEALVKLLKVKRPVPKELSSDVPSSRNLHTKTGHLKWRPVLMLSEVADQPVWAFPFLLTFWVTDPGTVDHL